MPGFFLCVDAGTFGAFIKPLSQNATAKLRLHTKEVAKMRYAKENGFAIAFFIAVWAVMYAALFV